MEKLAEIYKTLLREYGHQGWWPVSEGGKIKYNPGDYSYPRTGEQAFEVIMGTILTQNTSWKNAGKAVGSLIRNRIISPETIVRTNTKKLKGMIKSSGYYNQKAERLRTISSFILENYRNAENFLEKTTREELLKIRGIGPETADSILLYAGKRPLFVIDAYTRRVFSGMGILAGKETYGEIQSLFHRSLPEDRRIYNEYHALIVEHAKRFCRKRPSCGQCPIAGMCRTGKTNAGSG